MKRKQGVILVILIMFVLIVSFLLWNEKNKKVKVVNSNLSEEMIQEEVRTEVIYGKEQYIEHNEEGKRANTSSKMKERKQIQGETGVSIEEISLIADGNTTKIEGNVINTSKESKKEFVAMLCIKNEQGREILKVGISIPTLESNQTAKVTAIATMDLANAYDYTIEK